MQCIAVRAGALLCFVFQGDLRTLPRPQRISRPHAIPWEWFLLLCLLASTFHATSLPAQQTATPQAVRARIAMEAPAVAARRARAFAASHPAPLVDSAAAASIAAHAQHAALLQAQATSLSTAWKPVGPLQVQSLSYGLVTGRVTALALDPNDTSNSTLYVGTSGGGVWKSTSAASSSPAFTALTDTLSIFSPNSGTSVIPSLSIGALSVQPGGTGVILAGTGDPNDASDSYYGEGILRSTDNGQTWSLIQSANGGSFVGEGIAAFAWSTVSPQTVVAAVSSAAEAAAVGITKYPGVRGLYASANGGQTWNLVTIQDGSTIVQNRGTSYTTFRGNAATSVVWNPIRKKFYAAIRSHGYYESADGVTWTRMVNQPGTGLTTTNCPARPGDYGLQACPIFRGTLAVQPTSGDLFAITVDASNNIQGLWQDTCAKSGTACASTTVTWATQLDASPVLTSGTIPQGDYNLTLAAIPAATSLSSTDTLLFVGTSDLYRCSLQGGCSLRNTTNATTGCAAPAGVAPAQHATAWGVNLSNAATPTTYFGNDGGLWRSLDGVRQQAGICSADDATHFDNLNGWLGSLGEVVTLASDPADPNVLLAALGANGSAASITAPQATSSAPWIQLNAAESGTVAIDQGNGSNWLLQAGAGVALHACTSGKLCSATDVAGPAAIGAAQVSNDISLIDPPALLDPALNTNALVGTCRVWRGAELGGGLWSSSNAISAPLGGIADNLCNGTDATIRSLAAGGPAQITSSTQNSGSPVLYAGLSGALEGGSILAGHIFRTLAASTAGASTQWTDLTTNSVTNDTSNRFNAAGFDVSSIAVDRSDATGLTVYATIQGFGYPHVYRSTNGGTTWLNISANLPNAPANAVAIDPNDPRIVYVAMDTGVYVAQDVTTCVATSGTTGACWSVYGTALPNAPITSLVASAGITIAGASTAGILRAGTYGRGIWQIPLVTAGQSTSPVASLSPASLTFSAQAVGTSSALQRVTLTNIGTAPMQISGVSASAGFAATDTCSGTTLNVNTTCSINVLFAPTTAGTISGTVQIIANVTGGYASVPLTGTATGVANVVLTPNAISFGDVAVNTTSATQIVAVSNTGSGSATLSTPALTTDFAVQASTCGTTLSAGSTCTLSIVYAPTSTGANSGTLTLRDALATHTVSLSGNGVGTPNVVYPSSPVIFHDMPVTTSSVVLFTISNTGTASSPLSTPLLTGDFSVYGNTCDTVLFAGRSCVLSLRFTPTTTGLRTGTMTIVDAAGPHVFALQAYGLTQLSLTMPQELTFATTEVNSTSASQNLTVTNVSPGILYFQPLQVYGDFAVTANTCNVTAGVARGATCTLTITFAPTADGPRTGFVTLTATLAGVAGTTLLSGTAHGTASVSVTPSSLAFGTTDIGSTSPAQLVQISNPGTAALALTSQAITLDASFRIASSTCGTSLAAGASCALGLTFAPSTSGAHTGMLSLTDALGTHTVALSGTAQGTASVTLAPASIDFGSTALGQTLSRTVSVSNTGTAAATLSAPAITGDFRIASSTCGTSLASNASCTLSVVFAPTATGIRSGILTLADAAAQHSVAVQGTGIAGTLTASPTSIAFYDTTLHTTTAIRTIVLTNTGNGALQLGTVTATDDFAVSTNCNNTTLVGGATCTLSVTFTPGTTGAHTGTLSVPSNGTAGAVTTVVLTGNGKTPFNLTLLPTTADFGTQLVGTTSAAMNLTISNTGTISGALNSIAIAASDFTLQANTCGTSLAPQTGCTVSVTFRPTASGTRSGTLTIVSDAGRQTVPLSGIGSNAATDTLSPLALTFAQQVVNTISPAQTVTLSNDGDVPLTLVAAQILTGDFIAVNACGPTVPAHTACGISVSFTPKHVGVSTGVLQITDGQRAQTIALNGTAIAGAGISLSPSILTFANTGVGTAGAPQTLTLTNNGGIPLQLSAITLTGNFGIIAGSNTCSTANAIAVGGTCSMGIAFLPTTAGMLTGSVILTSNAATQSAQLTGTGVDFTFSASGATTATISSGNNTTYALLLRPAIATADAVTFACSGAPAYSKCTITPQYRDLSATGTVTVTLLTGTTATDIPGRTWLLLLPLPLWMLRRKQMRNALLTLAAVVLLITAQGCGANKVILNEGAGSSGGGGSIITPTGTYTLNVSATAAGVTHTVPLTLKVQ